MTVRLLNNEGYSYMLRGDLKAARAKFQSALKLDPNNQTTLNNITARSSLSALRAVNRAEASTASDPS